MSSSMRFSLADDVRVDDAYVDDNPRHDLLTRNNTSPTNYNITSH